MTAALRYEWRRITTVRSTWICLIIAALVGIGSGLLGYLVSFQTFTPPGDVTRWYLAVTFLLAITNVLGLVIGAQAIGQEYRFDIIRLTLTAFPYRARILTAKVLVVIVWAMILGLTTMLAGLLTAAAFGHVLPDGGITGEYWSRLVVSLVVVVGWALIGFAVACVTKQTALGIVLPLVWGLVVETALVGILGSGTSPKLPWLNYVLPFVNSTRAVEVADSGSISVVNQLSGWSALGVFYVWIVAFAVGAYLLFIKRDA
jgi:ABC-2 type transport system permease protein